MSYTCIPDFEATEPVREVEEVCELLGRRRFERLLYELTNLLLWIGTRCGVCGRRRALLGSTGWGRDVGINRGTVVGHSFEFLIPHTCRFGPPDPVAKANY